MMSSKAERLDLRVAIMASEARSVAYAHALVELLMRGQETDETHQALRREMDILAALQVHAGALDEGARLAWEI